MTTTEDARALDDRMKADRFDALYAEMKGAGHEVGFDAAPPAPTNHRTAKQLREAQAECRWYVRRHSAGTHDERRQPGCPYCFPPGPGGDYRP